MFDSRQEEIYWAWSRQFCRYGEAPPRSDFDPVDVPRSLSTLVLYQFVDHDAVLLRLVGTGIVEAWGTDHTGHRLEDFLHGDYYAFIRGQIDQCRAERMPVFSHSRFQWDIGRQVDTRRLLLPYRASEESSEIGFVLLSQVFDYHKTGPVYPLVQSVGNFSFTELERGRLDARARRSALRASR